jgi:hypothetical protein
MEENGGKVSFFFMKPLSVRMDISMYEKHNWMGMVMSCWIKVSNGILKLMEFYDIYGFKFLNILEVDGCWGETLLIFHRDYKI